MKILIVHTKWFERFLGGIESYGKNLIQKLEGDMYLIYGSKNPSKKIIQKKLGMKKIKVIEYLEPSLKKEEKYNAINLHLKEFSKIFRGLVKEIGDFDLIISLHSIYPLTLTKISKAKILFVMPSLNKIYFESIKYELENPDRKWWKKIIEIEKSILSNPRITTVVLSKFMLRLIRKNYHILKSQIKIIYPGSPKIKMARKKRPIDVLSVSRISREKNQKSLLKVAGISKASLIIVGEGPQREKLIKEAQKKNIINIHFIGEKKNPYSYYSKSKIFVLPSKYESFGLVLLEAMASGLPCIAFNPDGKNIITASDEIIKDGETGFLVKDENEMAEKIDLLLSNEKLRKKMGKAARKEAKKYSWKKTAEQILKFAKS